MDSTVVTTVDTMTVPLSEVFFPSVVVCNINQVRSSFFEEIGALDEDIKLKLYQDYILGHKLNKIETSKISKERSYTYKISIRLCELKGSSLRIMVTLAHV